MSKSEKSACGFWALIAVCAIAVSWQLGVKNNQRRVALLIEQSRAEYEKMFAPRQLNKYEIEDMDYIREEAARLQWELEAE